MRNEVEEGPGPKVVEQAAEWAAQLDSDQATQAQRDACEAWCGENPLHRLALGRMRGFDAKFSKLDDLQRGTLQLAIERSGGRNARLRRTLFGLCAILGIGWAAGQTFYARQLFADYRTAPGEQRTALLIDGSTLVIDTNGALDVDIGSGRRTVALFKGQVLARVARDPDTPFVVETIHGTATALGTAFIVRRDPESTLITVIESRVRVCPRPRATTAACVDLEPGGRVRVTMDGVTRLSSVNPDAATSWTRGWIEANDQPLAEVLSELNRYRRRPISFDPAAIRGVRVTGSYPLANTERALEAIAETAALKVVRSSDGDLTVLAHD